jgi:hypothetical protein
MPGCLKDVKHHHKQLLFYEFLKFLGLPLPPRPQSLKKWPKTRFFQFSQDFFKTTAQTFNVFSFFESSFIEKRNISYDIRYLVVLPGNLIENDHFTCFRGTKKNQKI